MTLFICRGDFLKLPYQATECFLANVRPLNGEYNVCTSGISREQSCSLKNGTSEKGMERKERN